MRTWQRAPIDRSCGRCGERIERGQPMLIITTAISGRKFIRCVRRRCAEERPPADLPPLVEHATVKDLQPMVPIRTGLDALPFDFKHAAAGREPGEDDE